MSLPEVPSWIDVTEGTAPILLFAPHGGRREERRIPGTHKVNDLWTADVTRQLATACGAATIVNAAMDRNVVDLNRLSQVRREAPWLLALLARTLDDMLARFGRATVLVVHGWNVSQPACDVGIGLREESGSLVACRPGAQTVSDAFVAERLRPLQARAEFDGITVTIGSRYPAAHPNNLLQLFRAVPEDLGDAGMLADLRERGPIDAAQVELAIPLRWPGPRRDRVIALLAETVTGAVPPPSTARATTGGARALSGRVTRRRGLQFVAGDILVMATIDATDAGPTGGRLVVSRDADRLALFTGELSSAEEAWRVPPLSLADGTGGLRLTFDGPMMTFPSHTPFVDLERGLADGSVIEGRFDIRFRPAAGGVMDGAAEVFGDVLGEIVVDGRAMSVATCGVATTDVATGPRRFPSCRVTLPTSPWGRVALSTDPDEALGAADTGWRGTLSGPVTMLGADAPARVDAVVALDDREGALTLRAAGGAVLEGRLERLIPVHRPGRPGTVVQTTFALVRVAGTCSGWLELTTVSAG